ncbi:MAG: hypothetical protein ACI4MH_07010 [Candidatus Coproplasma sp.]
MKKFLKILLLCAAAALCVCGVAACSDNTPETEAVTIEQLVEANDRQKVLEEYGNLQITLTGDSYAHAANPEIITFSSNDYGLIMIYENVESEIRFSYNTCIDGIRYVVGRYGDDVYYYASVIPCDYTEFISETLNIHPQADVGTPEIKDGKIIFDVTETYADADSSETYIETFCCNAETLLIEKIVFRSVADGAEGATDEYNFAYGEEYAPQLKAYSLHQDAGETGNFIVVRNAGTDGETRTEYSIAADTVLEVENYGETRYALYADADCTVEVENFKSYIKDGYVPVFYLAEKTLPTVNELLKANDAYTVVREYGSLHYSYTYGYDACEYEVEVHYSMNGYGLVYDMDRVSPDGDAYCSETAMNGIVYGYHGADGTFGEPGTAYVNVIIAEDYDDYVGRFYSELVFGENLPDTVSLSDGKIVLTGYSEEKDNTVYYYFNADTLLLESYKDGDIEIAFEYGVDYEPPRTAYDYHLNADDGKEIVIITYPDTYYEERTFCTVSASAEIKVFSDDDLEYALFDNPSCTCVIDDVNGFISGNTYPTLYVGEENGGAVSFVYTYSQDDYDEYTYLLDCFEWIAKYGDDDLRSVQVAYDYLNDKFLYIRAQSDIAYALYSLNNTDSNWDDYIAVYGALLQAVNATNATLKALYEADVAYNDVLFRYWTQEEIKDLLGKEEETDRELEELLVKNKEIQKTVRGMGMYSEEFISEGFKLYEQLVANNQRIAQLNGYENYYEYANVQTYSRDWDEEDIAGFCKYVKEYIVPLYNQLYRRYTESREKLTADQLKQADIIVSDIRYSQLETDYVSMYFNSFGGTLSERFNAMFDKNTALFAEGDGGSSTAFTGYLSYYGEPYCVFGSGDYYQSVNTLVHEAGHYVSAYTYSWNGTPLDLAETFSQSNEFLFVAFMKDYLDEEVYEYCMLYRLVKALDGIINKAVINEFETVVYCSGTDYTAADYEGIIYELCAEYGMSTSAARRFRLYAVYVSAISPCYYVSYGLSCVSALDLFATATKDYKSAQECYRILMEDAAKAYGFRSALAVAGIGSPFDESTYLNIKSAFDFDAIGYNSAVQDAILAEESEIRELVTLTKDDERVTWNGDGKVLLLTFHNYPDSYKEGETSVTGSWYMWTVTDGEIVGWYAQNQYSNDIFADKLKQVLGMPVSSSNGYISAVWVDVSDVIRPAYQPDPTKQLTAEDLDGSSLGEYKEWFNSNILSSYFSTRGQYPWTRLGYTYNWAADEAYGLTEFIILPGSEITVEFTLTINGFISWLGQQIAEDEAAEGTCLLWS